MAFVRPKARILERSTTSGGGPFALSGAVDGSYNAFASFMAVGDTSYASVTEPGVAFWTGIVTYSAANQITLTTVEETKGSFGAGTKEIFAGPLASTAMFREDISGAIVTGGTSTAYTVSSFRNYDSLARLDGNIIAFTPHITNGAGPVGLGVDVLGQKPLRAAPSTELMPGMLIQGTPYLALYNNTDGVFYLHGFFGNPYNVPLAAGLDYWGATTPNSAFAFPAGQAISRTTYAPLFGLIGATYGAGDGSTTFNLPDKTGRVSAMKEATATRLTSAGGGVDGATLGSSNSGNNQNVALATANLPPYTPSGAVAVTNGAITISGGNLIVQNTGASLNLSAGGAGATSALTASQAPSSAAFTGNAQGGSATPLKVVQPTIVCNYIMRVL